MLTYISNQQRLLLSSVLMIFVEMTLIRWAGSNIYQLFSVANLILIASFLGIGIGFLSVNKTKPSFHLSPFLLSLIILFCYLYSTQYHVKLTDVGNIDYAASPLKIHALPIFLTLPLIFIAVVATLASIANNVAHAFKLLPSLSAYRLEVLGSLIGVILFSAFSYMESPPIVWGIVITLLYFTLLIDTWRIGNIILTLMQICALIVMLGTFYKETITTNHTWSAYYKIETQPFLKNSYVVNVNGLVQQIIEPIEQRKKVKPFYIKPYEHVPQLSLDNVLVIGSGTGGDVAIVLSRGAKHVDAVEIDPALYRLGKKLNVDKPYDDARVSIFINDGRAFLQQTSKKYDLIIYALTDSLMLVPGLSSVRLENYLYTQEGLAAAAQHLKPNGVFTIYNYYGVRWFADRLGNTLNLVYQHPPCIDTYSAKDYWATVFTISPNAPLTCPTLWESTNQSYETPATDYHPFIYLKENTLPLIYIFTLSCMGLFTCLLMRRMGASIKTIGQNIDLFFMGTAFLLLETESIVNYALLFGTTWIVNSLVFIGILFSVYLAIEVTARVKQFNLFKLYGLLILSLLIMWLIPIHELLSFAPYVRFGLATLLTFTPIFIANLIFANRFEEAANSTDALGANLIGAVLGGFLEYSALIIGYQHFALIVLLIYTLAFGWLIYSKRLQTAIA